MSHDWRNHSSSPHHHEGDEPEPVWDAPRAAPTTVDEARAALLLAYPFDNDGFGDAVDALIAAVRAEFNAESYGHGLDFGRAESAETLRACETLNAERWQDLQHAEAKLAALREAANEAIGYLAVIGLGDTGHDHPHALVLADRLGAALAATPAEDEEGRT